MYERLAIGRGMCIAMMRMRPVHHSTLGPRPQTHKRSPVFLPDPIASSLAGGGPAVPDSVFMSGGSKSRNGRAGPGEAAMVSH